MDFRTNKTTKFFASALPLFSFILTMGFLRPVKAFEVKYIPAFCETKDLGLIIKNKTSEPQRFWTQVRLEDDFKEIFYEVESYASLEITGVEILSEKMAFTIKALEKNSLQITAQCKGFPDVPLSDVTSPQVTHFFPKQTKTVSLHLLNLFLNLNTVNLKALNNKGRELGRKKIQLQKYYDTQNLVWSFEEEVSQIEISSEQRVHSLMFYRLNGGKNNLSPAVSLEPFRFPIDEMKTYFLVSTKNDRPEDAFVIALDDPAKIEIAREQIKNPDLEKIIVAGITLGNGGFNRAFYSKDKSPYSWSVSSVDAFADFAHIDCDGSPDLTEERLVQKLNSGGSICFWRYRIVRELTPLEVSTGILEKK